MCKNLLLAVALVSFCGIIVEARNRNQTLCYRFTWLGPEFHNGSLFRNGTCQERLGLASGIPCEQPLVVSFDGTWPDVDYILEHHSDQATCVLGDGDVCAQITYSFNGVVENSTYLCTRAVDSNNTAITRGCFQQARGSSLMRVCLCRSGPDERPCNSSAKNSSILLVTYCIVFVLSLFLNKPYMWLSIIT